MKCQYAVSINTYKRVIWHEAQSSYTAVHLVNNAMVYHLYHDLIALSGKAQQMLQRRLEYRSAEKGRWNIESRN